VPSKTTRVSARMFRTPLRRDAMLPEFRAVRRNPAKVARLPVARKILRACERMADERTPIPDTTYTLFREYRTIGVRRNYDQVYHRKRAMLGAAALLAIFKRRQRWIDVLQDYIWNVCEETTWVPPEHMRTAPIDLFAAETAFALAETTHLLSDALDPEVVDRVRDEVERRVLAPYLEMEWSWFDGHNNWSGVCNGAVGAAFLYLEKSPARLARAVNKVLKGLEIFRRRAFLADGGSSEGAGYWQYGLINTVAFSELLRRRTGGKVDFLSHEKFKRIALYPLATLVAPGEYYSCSDCHGTVRFSPGFISRLAERTGAEGLKSLLNRESIGVGAGRLPWSIRDLLWWDGKTPGRPKIDDRVLPDTGVARLVDPKHKMVLMAKAGNNAENHNHNDVGSFAVYVDAEPLLCDPGCGLYDRAYFGPQRYENPVCNSYGHSVPRIDGHQQGCGPRYQGKIISFDPAGRDKTISMEFARTYPVKRLKRLQRTIQLDPRGAGAVRLEDRFAFSHGAAPKVEEAFTTWNRISLRRGTARIRGGKRDLLLKILDPPGAAFSVEDIPVMMAGATEPRTLRRLACRLPKGSTSFAMEITLV